MPRLTRDDSGAVAVFVAMLLTFGFLGFGALVVDVGSLYAERRQLQNGADAGALAVAQAFAHKCMSPYTCKPGTDAAAYANDNANDGASAVDHVCGRTDPALVGAPALPACPPRTTEGWDCPALPTAEPFASAPYVEVQTSTLQSAKSGGGTLMPPLLSHLLVGNEADPGRTVRACARASLASLGATSSFALTVSYCEWDVATNGGTNFAAPPPYPPNTVPPTSYEQVLKLHSTGAAACPKSGHSGSDAPGAFGWLDDAANAGSCHATVAADGTYKDDPGVSVSNSCADALVAAAAAPHTVLYLPIYDSINGTGNNATYHLKGFAAFVVTGWNLPAAHPKSQDSWLYPGNPLACKGSDKCVYGYFTQALVPAGVIAAYNPLGTTVIQMTG